MAYIRFIAYKRYICCRESNAEIHGISKLPWIMFILDGKLSFVKEHKLSYTV